MPQKVLLAIGRRGSPRKLNVPGEESTKVAYRLLEPELIYDKKIVVVGGGDSAVEAALLLAGKNVVTLSYRKDAFSRLKHKNRENLEDFLLAGRLEVLLNSELRSIDDKIVSIEVAGKDNLLQLENDLVYIFAGGELPSEFLKNAGIEIIPKFGEAIMKHEKR